jgi:DNA polymerase III sliding clamp (beta) subunit (PCNA family)
LSLLGAWLYLALKGDAVSFPGYSLAESDTASEVTPSVEELSNPKAREGQGLFDLRLGLRAELFHRLLRTSSYFSDRMEMIVSEGGMESRLMDQSRISMLDFKLDQSTFESYAVKNPPIRISFQIQDALLKLGRGLKAGNKVELLLDSENDSGSLKMVFDGKRSFEYTLEFERSEVDLPALPKVNFESSLRVASPFLREVLEDVKVISDRVRILASQNRFEFISSSDKGRFRCTIASGSPQTYGLSCTRDSDAEYGLHRILEFLDSLKPVIVTLEYSSKAPLKVSEEFVSGSYTLGFASLYLAPILRE